MVGGRLSFCGVKAFGSLQNKELSSSPVAVVKYSDTEAEEDDSYDKVNELLSDDFQIRDIAGEDIEFYDIQDEDLSQYDRMNSHYYDSAYNDYGNEEANYYYDNSMEEMFNKKKQNLEMSFHSEGVDIK